MGDSGCSGVGRSGMSLANGCQTFGRCGFVRYFLLRSMLALLLSSMLFLLLLSFKTLSLFSDACASGVVR